MLKVCILDYGSGNVGSVNNILLSLTPSVKISNQPKDIETATHLILPGVGAFGASMQKILAKIPIPIVEKRVFKEKKPFLGICVGMQVLANTGYEFGKEKGLGWISGEVQILKTSGLPLPHIGWNNVNLKKSSPLFTDLKNNQDFYFLHSYALDPIDKGVIVSETTYGENFAAAVQKDNIYGVQFHPEKSQKAGRQLLANFLSLK